MQITIELDEKLLNYAKGLTEETEPAAIVQAAMTKFVQGEAAHQLALLGGSEPQLKRIPRRRMPR